VDTTLIHAGVFDRERVITVVFNEEGFTRIKKFPAVVVTNREYRCIPKGAHILFFSDEDVPVLYVQYDVPETAGIKQQEFDTTKVVVRERDGKSSMMSSKKIAYIGAAKPKKWDDALTGPKGTYMDF
jgi:hypothetical protein